MKEKEKQKGLVEAEETGAPIKEDQSPYKGRVPLKVLNTKGINVTKADDKAHVALVGTAHSVYTVLSGGTLSGAKMRTFRERLQPYSPYSTNEFSPHQKKDSVGVGGSSISNHGNNNNDGDGHDDGGAYSHVYLSTQVALSDAAEREKRKGAVNASTNASAGNLVTKSTKGATYQSNVMMEVPDSFSQRVHASQADGTVGAGVSATQHVGKILMPCSTSEREGTASSEADSVLARMAARGMDVSPAAAAKIHAGLDYDAPWHTTPDRLIETSVEKMLAATAAAAKAKAQEEREKQQNNNRAKRNGSAVVVKELPRLKLPDVNFAGVLEDEEK